MDIFCIFVEFVFKKKNNKYIPLLSKTILLRYAVELLAQSPDTYTCQPRKSSFKIWKTVKK